ncbi:MAG: PKD domain-containing protein [Bacteroidia bacterium]|nr:PKD domain-containing protein [Bacteroidia bacterium]
MKTFISSAFLILFSICIYSQDPITYTKKFPPVDTGYVFIDGEYIESPYIVEIKELTIFINDRPVSQKREWPEKNPYYFDHDLSIPPELTQNSTIDDMLKAVEPSEHHHYIAAKAYYLFSHFEANEAQEKIVEYVRSFPNVKSLTGKDEVYTIETWNGETRSVIIGGSQMVLNSKKWGPKGKGGRKGKGVIESLKKNAEYEVKFLKDGSLRFYANSTNYSAAYSDEAEKRLTLLIKTMEDNSKSKEEKEQILLQNRIVLAPNQAKVFVEHWSSNNQLNGRVKKIEDHKKKRDNNNDMNLKNTKDLPDGTKSLDDPAFTPYKRNAYAWIPYTYDDAFSQFNEEITEVEDNIIGQDYYAIDRYIDNHVADPQYTYQTYDQLVGTCHYINFIEMANGGFLYVLAHGNTNGILLTVLNTLDDANLWVQGDESFYFLENTNFDWPDGSGGFLNPIYVFATPEWPLLHWQYQLTQNNAITILSVCDSYTSGWAQNCGGGAVFSYNSPTSQDDCIYNNEQLLGRMNGSIHLFQNYHRKAGEAYNRMISTGQVSIYDQSDFKITPDDANITLCPSPVDYTKNAVSTEDGTGYIEFDTWCNSTISATQTLTLQVISGNVTLSNFNWVNPTGGKSNRIEYNWNGDGNFQAKITVNYDKIRSYSGTSEYHRLDFDKQTPIEEESYFCLIYSDGIIPGVNFFADNTNVPLNTTVNFYDISSYDEISAWSWNFGNGSTSDLQNPSHTYTSAGSYTVSLFITTTYGNFTETKTGYITVFDESSGDMTCDISYSPNDISTPVLFTGNFLGYSSPDYTYVFRFVFDYNSQYQEIDGNIPNATVTYQYPVYGTYHPYISLKINNSSGAQVYSSVSSCEVLYLENPDPCYDFVVNFSISPSTITPGGSYTITDLTTGGTPPYNWCWFFLMDPYTGNTPEGGEQSQCINGIYFYFDTLAEIF